MGADRFAGLEPATLIDWFRITHLGRLLEEHAQFDQAPDNMDLNDGKLRRSVPDGNPETGLEV